MAMFNTYSYPANYNPNMSMGPNYNNPMPNYMNNNYQNSRSGNTGITWVQGEAGAKSFWVEPGTTVPLWDSESQTIYLKSADASGMPSMRILDYTFRDNSHNSFNGPIIDTSAKEIQNEKYATKDDIDNVNKQLASIRSMLSENSSSYETHDNNNQQNKKNR